MEKSYNEALEQNSRNINSKPRGGGSLAWDLYEPFYVETKDTDLKWYFCTMCYTNKKEKEGGNYRHDPVQ